ncbi:MAG: hydrogenase maturation nickel metallochaperone HypA [Treponemataceae bacterium]|nr:hydrogenase maturation nickel metallochaperone HypA [Treponemataceae bacterium]
MHELGIVFYIIKDVKEAAKNNNVSKIKSVTLELGEVSAVIPYYLEDCWKWSIGKEGPLLHDTELIIETIPAVTFCEGCEKEYPTVQYGKICPYCKSEKTYLRRGNEVMIKQIEAMQAEPGQEPVDTEGGVSVDSGFQAEDY